MSTMRREDTASRGNTGSQLRDREGKAGTAQELQRSGGTDTEVGWTEEQGEVSYYVPEEPTGVLGGELRTQPPAPETRYPETEEEKAALWQEYCRLKNEEEARKEAEEQSWHDKLREVWERNR